MIGGGRPFLPEILSQSDQVTYFTSLLFARRRYYRLLFFGILFVCYNCVSFYLILILCFLFGGELISIPKFFESFIYTFYFILL